MTNDEIEQFRVKLYEFTTPNFYHFIDTLCNAAIRTLEAERELVIKDATIDGLQRQQRATNARLSALEQTLSETRAQLQHAWTERGFDSVILECNAAQARLSALEKAATVFLAGLLPAHLDLYAQEIARMEAALSGQPEQTDTHNIALPADGELKGSATERVGMGDEGKEG